MADSPTSDMSPKRNVVGGKKHRFAAALVFLVLGVISGILAIALPPSGGMMICRYLGFLFGLLFVLFLVFGFLGRFHD